MNTSWQVTAAALWIITFLIVVSGVVILPSRPRGFAVLKTPDAVGAIAGWMTGLIGFTFWVILQ